LTRRFRRFLPLSLAAFIALLWGVPGIPARSVIAVTLAYAAAGWFARDVNASAARTRAGVILLIVYAAAFSLIAHDVVMLREPGWTSTLFPAYVALSNVYGGIAAIACAIVLSSRGRAWLTAARTRDLAMIVVGFAMLWLYFVWSQFLVIWYGNLPDEAAFIVRRAAGGWRTLAWAILATRCALPVVALLAEGGRHRWMLGMIAAVVVAGFWAESLLVVGPAMAFSPASTALVTSLSALLFFASVLPGRPAARRQAR
jgi:hypothetical protein